MGAVLSEPFVFHRRWLFSDVPFSSAVRGRLTLQESSKNSYSIKNLKNPLSWLSATQMFRNRLVQFSVKKYNFLSIFHRPRIPPPVSFSIFNISDCSTVFNEFILNFTAILLFSFQLRCQCKTKNMYNHLALQQSFTTQEQTTWSFCKLSSSRFSPDLFLLFQNSDSFLHHALWNIR